MQPSTPLIRDLVLLGGGHAHIEVLYDLIRHPLSGVRVSLISNHPQTLYSGMVPGLLAGRYRFDQCQIDLQQLCQKAGAELILDQVESLEPEQQLVVCHAHTPVHYDWLSINTGCITDLNGIPGAAQRGVATKPIAGLWQRWQQLEQQWLRSERSFTLVVVGGGAASVELVLAADQRLRTLGLRQRVQLELVAATDRLLPERPARVHRYLHQRLAQASIRLRCNSPVTGCDSHTLHLEGDEALSCDEVIWGLPASAPDWPAASGLACNTKGFIQVNASLQSLSHPSVFAAGDITHFDPPLPKSGVYAVRQGPVLARNLRRACSGRPLHHYHPQRKSLALLNLGNGKALACRGALVMAGRWAWYLKSWIDRRFVARFNRP